MNSKIMKIVSALLAAFIVIYVGIQIVNFVYSPYETQTVFRSTVNNSLFTQGLVIRDETVIQTKKEGILNYQVQNGGKVAQQSVIAEKYSSEQDMLLQNRIDRIDREIVLLTQAQQKGVTAAATLDSLTAQINESYLELMSAVNHGEHEGLTDYRLKLQELFCKKQIVIGKATDFNQRIDALKSQKSELRSGISVAPSSIKSPESGYFAQTVDGLESVYSCSKAQNLTLQDLTTVLETVKTDPIQHDNTKIGKIIRTFEWKIAVVIPTADLPSLTGEKAVQLVFPSFGSTQYPATVSKIEESTGDGGNLVIFDCNVMDNVISRLRVEDVEIVLSSVTGIQVPKKAIRYEEEQMGVYEKIGQKLYFRKIDQLYETEDYVISKIRDEQDTAHEYVHVYDDVVVKGKDLYDKKKLP